MRWKLPLVGACAIMSVPAIAVDLPDEAPAGQRWMGCWVDLQGANYAQKQGVAGYWLVTAPDEAEERTVAVDALSEQFLKEYSTAALPDEAPGFQVRRHGCVTWKHRHEFKSYSAWSKQKLSLAYRSEFVPTFSKGHSPSKVDARPE